ncbi:phosphonomutase [Actinomadura sp. CNU-125]|uniref:isocitrate lyase/PEP mutase family protein n=1 Tax=Actinomadura sp. CNU-125 TaxID=1904961 RepID=UPI0009611C39|nr:isocitrate lyase/phosphoenolpyruvate mutase family protein [Actinomadura sp. CNU-125]OLT10904.1 phosphonomutase [Actinomadura sp. CNU-125]
MDFGELHRGERPLLLPNAWDFASGAALAAAGFAAIGTTSLGVAAAAGKPDAAGGTREETLALARRLVRLPVPVSVDVEAGFSDRPDEVAALVAELASFGVAGVNIEDGRPGGGLAPVRAHARVVEAVKRAAPGMFVNARTDTYWLGGDRPSLDETLRRVRAYADAGADGVFVPGIADDDDIAAVVAAVDVPLNVLHLPGRTGFERLAELGAGRVSCGSLLFREALHAAVTSAFGVTGEEWGGGVPSYGDVVRLIAPPSP